MEAEVKQDNQPLRELNVILDIFNGALKLWEKKHGCTATYRWNYEGDSKVLAVQEITKCIHKEEMTDAQINTVLTQLQDAEPAKVKPQ